MKSVDAVLAEIDKHLATGWHLDLGIAEQARWPKVITLGTISSTQADGDYVKVMAWSHRWHDWAHDNSGKLSVTTRRIRGIDHHDFPTHLTIATLDEAARAVGNGWTARLTRARQRANLIAAAFPETSTPTALRLADQLDDTDFALALATARWFADNPDVWPGLTPRQVPVTGLHAKWLDTHRPLVKILAGLNDLTLAERGTRIYWTYLDPDYRRSGRRVHDSLTLGDNVDLPYTPKIVLIVENKDTAILFPELPSAIVVEGNGNASVGLLPLVGWIAETQTIIYWGDIDARGYEIVNGLRERLPQVQTILMDQATYDRYEAYSTNVDERGLALKPRKRQPLPRLTDAERAVYLDLTDPDWSGNRRFEQERIPLASAMQHVSAAVAQRVPRSNIATMRAQI